MIEVVGNLWTYPADVRVITTNGTVKKNGECVMGRGCAAEAKSRPEYSHYNIAKLLGDKIMRDGNHVHYLGTPAHKLYSFPVKHHWHERADIVLIERSTAELLREINELTAKMSHLGRPLTVVLPRPGCGNGGLRWCNCKELEAAGAWDKVDGGHCYGVKHVLGPILDDRFHVITFGHGQTT